MKKKILGLLATVLIVSCEVPPAEIAEIGIIPQPKQIEQGEGLFIFDADCYLVYDEDFELEANHLRSWIEARYKINIPFKDSVVDDKAICLLKSATALPIEAYQMSVSKSGVDINATYSEGCFHGVQTLVQIKNWVKLYTTVHLYTFQILPSSLCPPCMYTKSQSKYILHIQK